MQTVNSNFVGPNTEAIGVDPTGNRPATLSDDDARHWELIRTPLGRPWSGRTRYAAAMHLYQKGELSAEVLEVYRACSRLDSEDPLAIIQERRIDAQWLEKLAAKMNRDRQR